MLIKNNIISPNCLLGFILLAIILIIGSFQSTIAKEAECTQKGNDSYCRGYGTEALGAESTAIGTQVIACEARSTAIGLRTWAEADSVFVVGKWNARAIPDKQCTEFKLQGISPVFVVGTGLGETSPFSERYRNGLTVLENGQTVIGLVRSPNTEIDKAATLNVLGSTTVRGNITIKQGNLQTEGNIVTTKGDITSNAGGLKVTGNITTTGGDIQGGTGNITVNRSPSVDWRAVGLWSTGALKGLTCDSACGTGICLVSYADKEEVNKLKCSAKSPNKTCLCAGRR